MLWTQRNTYWRSNARELVPGGAAYSRTYRVSLCRFFSLEGPPEFSFASVEPAVGFARYPPARLCLGLRQEERGVDRDRPIRLHPQSFVPGLRSNGVRFCRRLSQLVDHGAAGTSLCHHLCAHHLFRGAISARHLSGLCRLLATRSPAAAPADTGENRGRRGSLFWGALSPTPRVLFTFGCLCR